MTPPFDVYSKFFGMWITVTEVFEDGYFLFRPADKPSVPAIRSRSKLSEFRQRRKTR